MVIMKRVGQLLVTLLAISIFLLPSINSEKINPNEEIENEYKYQNAYRYNAQGWIYLHLEGEPYERGYQYGHLVAEEIIDSMYRWKEFIVSKHTDKHFFLDPVPDKNLDERIWDVYINRAKLNFLNKVPDEYLKEIEGIADGIKDKGLKVFNREITFEDILVLHFIQDIMFSNFQFIHKSFSLLNIISSRVLSVFSKFSSRGIELFDMLAKWSLGKLLTPRDFEEHPGHCSAFIATGEYTEDGGIVVAHSTVIDQIIAQRCNIIVNVEPTEGYSFTMTTFPGSVWSQEDWYQNEKGIVLTETELRQGPFSIRKTPKGIRSRTAIQYSESIDDVIRILQHNNNGLIPNEWLIGDKKTGEIASLEQAYYNTPIKRSYSDFYWSSNVPHNEKVKTEIFGGFNAFKPLEDLVYNGYDVGRSTKFEELKEKYKGEVNLETAKEILATYPINSKVSDGKITTSELLENNGLEVYLGNPNGSTFMPSKEKKEIFSYITEQPATGWMKIFATDTESKTINPQKKGSVNLESPTQKLWQYENEEKNGFSFCPVSVNNDEVYVGNSDGDLVILSKDTGFEKRIIDLEEDIFKIKNSDGKILIGSDDGIKSINHIRKVIEWDILPKKTVYSISDIHNGKMFAGCEDGSLYAIESDSGLIDWHHTFKGPVYVSETFNDKVFFASEKKCYAINKEGRILWDFNADGVITSSPVYKDGKIFFGSWDNKLYCLDQKDGSLIWSFETGWGIDSPAEIAENTVFVGGLDNNLYALDKNSGELKWFFETKSAIHSKPVAYGDYVFFGSDDGRVYALDKINGKQAWSFAPEYTIGDSVNNYMTSPILSDVAVDDGVLYFGINNGVYALDAQTFEKEEIKEKDELISKNVLMVFIVLLIILGIFLILFSIYGNKKRKE